MFVCLITFYFILFYWGTVGSEKECTVKQGATHVRLCPLDKLTIDWKLLCCSMLRRMEVCLILIVYSPPPPCLILRVRVNSSFRYLDIVSYKLL